MNRNLSWWNIASLGGSVSGGRGAAPAFGELALELFRLLAQFEPVEEQVGSLQPDAKPMRDLLLFPPLWRADVRISGEGFRPLFSFQNQRTHQGRPHAIRSFTVLAVERVQLSEGLLGAFKIVKMQRSLEAAVVGLLHNEVEKAVFVINGLACLTQDSRDIGERGVRSQAVTQFRFESPDLFFPDALETLHPAKLEDDLFLARRFRHLDSTLPSRLFSRAAAKLDTFQ